jgi:hypothetical protein
LKNGSLAEFQSGNWWNNLDEEGNRLKAKEADLKENAKSIKSDDMLGSESSGTKRGKKGQKLMQ